jgi:hypothetical protein
MASAFKFLSTPRVRDQATPGQGRAGGAELSLYKERPAGDISLEEFEKYALDRLRSEGRPAASPGAGRSSMRSSDGRAPTAAGPRPRCPPALPPAHAVLKAIEEAKLRSKGDDVLSSEVKRLVKEHMQASTTCRCKPPPAPAGRCMLPARLVAPSCGLVGRAARKHAARRRLAATHHHHHHHMHVLTSKQLPACALAQEPSRQETARKDNTSHFILRLAYCRTADLRNWILAQARGGLLACAWNRPAAQRCALRRPPRAPGFPRQRSEGGRDLLPLHARPAGMRAVQDAIQGPRPSQAGV